MRGGYPMRLKSLLRGRECALDKVNQRYCDDHRCDIDGNTLSAALRDPDPSIATRPL